MIWLDFENIRLGFHEHIMWITILSWFSFFSDDVRDLGFTVIIDMRGGSGSAWSTVKPILKVLQEYFPNAIHTAHLIKPDNFWQKQRTSMGSQKYKFEVNIIYQDSFDNSIKVCHNRLLCFAPLKFLLNIAD